MQIVIFIFISGFLGAVTISIIAAINNNQKNVGFRSVLRENLAWYAHIFVAIIISLSSFVLLSALYKRVSSLAATIKTQAGFLSFINKILYSGEPYFNLLLGVITTAIFIFVIPVIVIDKKKFGSALILNFRYLKDCFWLILIVISLPTLFYVPILFLRNNISVATNYAVPETQVILIIAGIVMTLFIDAIVYTATTTYYLFVKEAR